jgi:hypothetical protein
LYDLLTAPQAKSTKPFDPKERLKGLVSIEPAVLEEFLWGRRFGKIQKQGMVWKHGSPYLYPKHEFEQIKAIILVMEAAEEEKERSERIIKHDRPELPEDVRQKKLLRASLFHRAMSKKAS